MQPTVPTTKFEDITETLHPLALDNNKVFGKLKTLCPSFFSSLSISDLNWLRDFGLESSQTGVVTNKMLGHKCNFSSLVNTVGIRDPCGEGI